MHEITNHFEDPLLDGMVNREVLVDNRGNSNELEDYQVVLAVDESHLFFEAQDGLRFVDENLKIINHLNESFPDTQWVKVPLIPASAMCSLRLFDGDPSMNSRSSGPDTFRVFEDFSGTNQIFTIAGNHIVHDTINDVLDCTGMTNSEDSYAYYDLGVGAIGNFLMEYTAQYTASSNGHERGDTGIANELDDAYNNTLALISDTVPGSSYHFIKVTQFKNTAGIPGNNIIITSGTVYYYTLYRSGTDLTLKLYSDSARTNLIGTSTVSGVDTTTVRYVFAVASLNYAGGNALGASYVTDLRMRKYSTPEPTAGIGAMI